MKWNPVAVRPDKDGVYLICDIRARPGRERVIAVREYAAKTWGMEGACWVSNFMYADDELNTGLGHPNWWTKIVMPLEE